MSGSITTGHAGGLAVGQQQFLGVALRVESRNACICRTHQSLRPRADDQSLRRRVRRHKRVRFVFFRALAGRAALAP